MFNKDQHSICRRHSRFHLLPTTSSTGIWCGMRWGWSHHDLTMRDRSLTLVRYLPVEIHPRPPYCAVTTSLGDGWSRHYKHTPPSKPHYSVLPNQISTIRLHTTPYILLTVQGTQWQVSVQLPTLWPHQEQIPGKEYMGSQGLDADLIGWHSRYFDTAFL